MAHRCARRDAERVGEDRGWIVRLAIIAAGAARRTAANGAGLIVAAGKPRLPGGIGDRPVRACWRVG